MIDDLLTEHFRTLPADLAAEDRIVQAVLTPARRPRTGAAVAAAIVLVLALVATLFALRHRDERSAPADAPHALIGVTWLDTAASVTLVFTATTMHEADGCNGFTRVVTWTAGRFRVGREVGDGYSCAGSPMPQPGQPGYRAWLEQHRVRADLDRVLHDAPRWTVHGTTLVLSAGARSVDLTDRGTARVALPGSRWIAEQTDSRPIASNPIHFGKDGRFRAADTCGIVITGSFAMLPNRIRFANVDRAPLKPCGRPVGSSFEVIPVRTGTVRYQIENNRLRLWRRGSELILRPAA